MVVVRFAPTPLAPLLYVTIPLVIFARVSGVATKQASWMFNPWTKSSTYCLVAASFELVGVATEVILALYASTVPLPVGRNNIEWFPPAAVVIVISSTGALIRLVITEPLVVAFETLASVTAIAFAEIFPLAVILPELIVELTLIPVPEITSTLEFPATLIATLLFCNTWMLELPFEIPEVFILVR